MRVLKRKNEAVIVLENSDEVDYLRWIADHYHETSCGGEDEDEECEVVKAEEFAGKLAKKMK